MPGWLCRAFLNIVYYLLRLNLKGLCANGIDLFTSQKFLIGFYFNRNRQEEISIRVLLKSIPHCIIQTTIRSDYMVKTAQWAPTNMTSNRVVIFASTVRNTKNK